MDRLLTDILVKHGKTPHETSKVYQILTVINDIINDFT